MLHREFRAMGTVVELLLDASGGSMAAGALARAQTPVLTATRSVSS